MSNHLVIVADDLRYDYVMGTDDDPGHELNLRSGFMPKTRRALCDLGLSFSNCRSNVPICQPTRVGMMSGQYSKRHGVTDNGTAASSDWVTNDRRDETWIKDMDDDGYRTGLIGKWMNALDSSPSSKPAGFDTWRQIIDANEYGFSVYDGTSTTTPSGGSIAYIEDEVDTFLSGSEPWLLLVTPHHPHWPFSPDRDNLHRWRRETWTTTTMMTAAGFGVAVGTKPSWVQAKAALTGVNPNTGDYATINGVARNFMREASTLDDFIGRLLAQIDFADTVVWFTSDNGVHLGEHRYWTDTGTKFMPYEPSMHVPLFVRGSGINAGIDPNLVTQQDIGATICAMEGVTPTLTQDGIDLRDTSPTRTLLHEYGDATGTGAAGRPIGDGISTPDWKLTRWDDTGDDEFEMYRKVINPPLVAIGSRLDDPYEIVNVAHRGDDLPEQPGTSYLSVRNALEAELDALLA